ncbi:unnamed protein product [Alternaria alternata]
MSSSKNPPSPSKNPASPSKNPPSPYKNPRSPSKAPTIPDRTSSKRAFEQVESNLLDARRNFDKKKKHLKPSKSFDSNFWSEATEYAVMGRSVSRLELQRAVMEYVRDGKGSEKEFRQSERARALEEEAKAWALEERIFSKRVDELKVTGEERSLRRSFMQLFTSSPLGLEIKNALAGKRNSSMQSNFRKGLLKDQSQGHPDSVGRRDFYWNIVSWNYEPSTRLQASHIFPYKVGQEMMTAVFGSEAENELFSSHNGLLLPTEIENQFDSGMIAIVPDIKDLKSKTEVQAWVNSNPREYKFKIFLDDERLQLDWPATTDENNQWLSFRQIDGRKLKFPNGCKNRPRARYLYFHYCCQILRLAWRLGAKAGGSLPIFLKEQGIFAWGTGKYMAHNMLRAFIDEVGHEFEPLMENATQLDTMAEGRTVSLACASAIKVASDKVVRNVGDQEYDDDEDDEE